MGMPVIRGRDFTALREDRTSVVIVVKLIATLQGEAPPSGIIGLAAAVASVAVTVALIATLIPARRAATIDPILALRVE